MSQGRHVAEQQRELTHALSFDIEDWFHAHAVVDTMAEAGNLDPEQWPEYASVIETRTQQILAMLAEHKTRATFFILGWVAERYPDVVKRVQDGGHEIASHSYWHRKVFSMDEKEFMKDLADSIAVLEHFPGVRIRGFRAPSFSITPGTEWAFDAMIDAGLSYDASLFPARRTDGGYPCPLGPHVIERPAAGRSPSSR